MSEFRQTRSSGHRTVVFGITPWVSSLAPVGGEVSLVRSHSVMAARSAVNPSSVLTGSVMISAVTGHVYSLSTFTATDAPAALPLPPRAPACFGQAPPSEAAEGAEAAVQGEGVTRHDLRTRMPEHAWRKFLAQVSVRLPPECTRSSCILCRASAWRRTTRHDQKWCARQSCFAQP